MEITNRMIWNEINRYMKNKVEITANKKSIIDITVPENLIPVVNSNGCIDIISKIAELHKKVKKIFKGRLKFWKKER